jgi:hypothetical protein
MAKLRAAFRNFAKAPQKAVIYSEIIALQNCAIPDCCVENTGNSLPTFRDNMSSHLHGSRIQEERPLLAFFLDSSFFKRRFNITTLRISWVPGPDLNTKILTYSSISHMG